MQPWSSKIEKTQKNRTPKRKVIDLFITEFNGVKIIFNT